MGDIAYLGVGPVMVPVPGLVWRRAVERSARTARAMMASTSEELKQVRDHAVREIARTGEPVTVAAIAEARELPADRVAELLEEAELKKVFLARNDDGDVLWAYPVTAAATPHTVRPDTGGEWNAA